MASRKATQNFIKAIKANNIETVRAMLKKNPELSKGEKCPKPTLWDAATLGHHEIVELLIQSGDLDVNEKKPFGSAKAAKWCTILHWMAYETVTYHENHTKVGEILLRHGADVNACDHEDETPVQTAIQKRNFGWTKFLLEKGANFKGLKWKSYSLEFSILGGSYVDNRKEMIPLLFKHGLDPEYKNEEEKNLLYIYIQSCASKTDYTAEKIVELLVDSGVPIYDVNNSGFSALHCAVRCKKIKIVSLLIKKGADVNRKNNNDETPLHLAWAHKNITELLLSSGADINARNYKGRTVLHDACKYWIDNVISLLIYKGADISAVSYDGKTPLYILTHTRHTEESLWAFIKEIAKLRFDNVSINETYVKFTEINPDIKEIYEKCLTELNRMSSMKFYGQYSYFSVLKMSRNIKKLAHLSKNKELVDMFKKNLDEFDIYKEDLLRVLKDAVEVRNNSQAVYFQLHSIFRKNFPDIVIKILSDNLTLQDLPE